MTERPVIVCAGGMGHRMEDLSVGHNKHLLPIGHETALQRCVRFAHGFSNRVCVVTSQRDMQAVSANLEGEDIAYYPQPEYLPGVAGAIAATNSFCRADPPVVLLADNVFSDEFMKSIIAYSKGKETCFFSYTTDNPSAYGVVYQTAEGPRIIEKPDTIPEMRLGELVGAFSFDETVWHKLVNQGLSSREEFEIVPVLSQYLDDGNARHIRLVKKTLSHWWFDMGQSVSDYHSVQQQVLELE